MRNFDLIKKILKKFNLLGLHDLRKKGANSFTGGGRGTLMVMPRPHPSGSKQLNIRAFI